MNLLLQIPKEDLYKVISREETNRKDGMWSLILKIEKKIQELKQKRKTRKKIVAEEKTRLQKKKEFRKQRIKEVGAEKRKKERKKTEV